MASTIASKSPSRSRRSRVSTLPRRSRARGRAAGRRRSARRRRLVVPTRAPWGSCVETASRRRRARRGDRRARGSRTGRGPGAGSSGTSFRLCTARSTSPASSASSISFRKAPLPPTASSGAGRPVAGGGDEVKLDLVAEGLEPLLHVLGLPTGEGAPPRADADLHRGATSGGTECGSAPGEVTVTGPAACRMSPSSAEESPFFASSFKRDGRGVQELVDDGGGGGLERLLLLWGQRARGAFGPARSRPGGSRRPAGAAPPAGAPRRASVCQARNSRTSCSTRASAAAASLRRSRRLASATAFRSSRS